MQNMKDIDRKISEYERSRLSKTFKSAIPAIALVSLILAIYLFAYQSDTKVLVSERMVIGTMHSVTAQETRRGSNVIWVVSLVENGHLVLVSPVQGLVFEHGKKVELKEYTYNFGSKMYVFNRFN
jgi:hypothetical protein